MFSFKNKITGEQYEKHPANVYLGPRLFITSNPRAVVDRNLSENTISVIRNQSPFTLARSTYIPATIAIEEDSMLAVNMTGL